MSTKDDTEYTRVPTKETKNEEKIPESYGFGTRHIQTFIIFLSLSTAFLARGHISITVVAMTDQPTVHDKLPLFHNASRFTEDGTFNKAENKEIKANVTISENRRTVEKNKDETQQSNEGLFTVYKTFNWHKSEQEMILGSFFVGYSIMMLPMGMVCQKYGGKLPLQIALFVNGIASILTPWLAALGDWKAVCACRVLQGLSQSGMYPSIQVVVAKWGPPSERGRLTSYVYTGTTFGTVVALQLGGLLADSKWGWPSVFWVTGVLCLTMFTVVTVFVAATPFDHKSISDEERRFITKNSDNEKSKSRTVPWKAVMRSRPVWTNMVAHVGSGLTFLFFFNQVPSYVHYILGVNIKESGLLSSLSYIGSFIMSILLGTLSDYCTNKGILSVKNARRISNTISLGSMSLCLIFVTFTNNLEITVISFVIALSFYAAVHTGWMVNYIDLASNYAGSLMSIGNTFTAISYFILPILISYVIHDVTNRYEWRIMFMIIAGIGIVSNIIFVIFMSAETQPWNDYIPSKKDQNIEDGTDNKKSNRSKKLFSRFLPFINKKPVQ